MKNKLLEDLYDSFYIPPEFPAPKQEIEDCHQVLIERLEKPERKLVLQIIDAKDRIVEDTSIDSFIAGFELAWELSVELNDKYRTNGGNKPLRYLFSTLNEHIEWYRNGGIGTPVPQKGTVINYDNVTIEHIASQSPSVTVPGFTGENVHKLSNLTLLTNGENDRAKNKAYASKKAIYHDSEYAINKYFDGVDNWNVESADAWEQYLQEMVCKVFVV